jgi:hypothetical protein
MSEIVGLHPFWLQWSLLTRVRRLQSLAMVLEDGAAGGCPDYL